MTDSETSGSMAVTGGYSFLLVLSRECGNEPRLSPEKKPGLTPFLIPSQQVFLQGGPTLQVSPLPSFQVDGWVSSLKGLRTPNSGGSRRRPWRGSRRRSGAWMPGAGLPGSASRQSRCGTRPKDRGKPPKTRGDLAFRGELAGKFPVVVSAFQAATTLVGLHLKFSKEKHPVQRVDLTKIPFRLTDCLLPSRRQFQF